MRVGHERGASGLQVGSDGETSSPGGRLSLRRGQSGGSQLPLGGTAGLQHGLGHRDRRQGSDEVCDRGLFENRLLLLGRHHRDSTSVGLAEVAVFSSGEHAGSAPVLLHVRRLVVFGRDKLVLETGEEVLRALLSFG